jgi:hypothetical protein
VSHRPRRVQLSTIAQEILAYLAEHPLAQDTLEGIMHWWLLEQQIKHSTLEVQAALGELAAQGWVVERKGKDGGVHYRINRRKVREIRTLLDQYREV